MTDRDRLIELFQKMDRNPEITCPKPNDVEACKTCEYAISMFLCDMNARKVDYLLANGVIVQKQGEWKDNHNGTFICSVCGGKSSRMNYCGNCGANMNDNTVKCKDCKHWIYFADEKRCSCILTNNYTFRNYSCASAELKECEGK